LLLAGGASLWLATAPVRAEGGAALYLKHCAMCHGKDGKAQSPIARKLGVKDLAESKATDSEIETAVAEGRKDDKGNLKMPAFKDKLTAAETQSLVPVVKAFRP
jgi:cytochrome c6